MQSRIIKIIIFILFLVGSILFLKQTAYAGHGSYSASIPDSIEDEYIRNCPTTTGSSGYTIHGVYPSAGNVRSTTRNTSVTLNAASYLCELASYTKVTSIQIIVTSIEPINTTATMSLPSSYTFNVGDISAKKTFAGPVQATATVTGLTATSLNKGNNCFNVKFYAKATYGTTPVTSGTGQWPVCITWVPQVKVTSFTLNPYTWTRHTLQYTRDNYPGFISDYDVSLQAYINGAWKFDLETNLGNPTTNNPALFTILEPIGPGSMRVWVDIPTNFRIRRIFINGVQQDEAICGTSYCVLPFNIFNYSTDFVDIQFDYVKLGSNKQICPTSVSTPKFDPQDFYFAFGGTATDISKQNDWIYGYVFDAFARSDGKRIKIDIGRASNTTQFSYTYNSATSENVIFSSLIDGKGTAWALQVPTDKRVDKWEARGYFDTEGGSGTNYVEITGNPVIWGPGFANDCNINFYQDAISWLKTENGNVLSSTGYIQGNNLRTLSSQTTTVQTTVEGFNKAEYLVMAKIGKSFPFCSTYDYLLTNTLADGVASPSCGTGSGYTLNTYDLNTNSQDSVVASVQKAADSVASGCLVKITSNNVALSDLVGIQVNPQPSCPNGTVYSITPSSGSNVNLPAISNVNRRATILVDGTNGGSANAIINGNITYSTSSYPYNSMQSLAIVVNGNIYIKGGVTSIAPAPSIQAALYSAGKINTCYETIAAAQTRACDKQLIIEGMLVGKNGFQFQRTRSYTGITNYDDPLGNRVDTPAELVRFSPNIVINPPPGLNLYDFYSTTGYKYLLDKAEYSPRF